MDNTDLKILNYKNMKYEKGKKITDNYQFKKGRKYMTDSGEVFEFSHIGENGAPYFKDEGQAYYASEKEYNCIGFDTTDFYEAIEVQELPDEGLVVYKENGTIVYRTGKGTGYGFFNYRSFKIVEDNDYIGTWTFEDFPENWRQATPEEETKFIDLLRKECERRWLFKDTKIKSHASGNMLNLNSGNFRAGFDVDLAYNKNGLIFKDGKFAEPLEEDSEIEAIEVNGKEYLTEEALLQRFKEKGFGLYKIEEREKEINLTDEALKLQELAKNKGFKLVLTFEYIDEA